MTKQQKAELIRMLAQLRPLEDWLSYQRQLEILDLLKKEN